MNIAFLGLGAMGSRMAAQLAKAGYSLTVWNRSPERTKVTNAQRVASPREAAAQADVVISMVRDDAASNFVWLDDKVGALGGLRPDALAIECSTLSVPHVKHLANRIGHNFIDAPLAGSRPQADAAQLIFFAGGIAEAVARATPVLQHMGSAVHHTGPTGSGAAIKLAVNGLFSTQVVAIAELLRVLKEQGIDGAKAMEVIGATPVASPAVKGAAAGMLASNFAPQFPIQLVKKDLGYLQAMADGPLPVAKAVFDAFDRAGQRGLGDDNITAVAKLYT